MDLFNTLYHAPLGAIGLIAIIVSFLLFIVHYYISKNTIITNGLFKGVIVSNHTKHKVNHMYKNIYSFVAHDGVERICRSGVSSSMMSKKPIGSIQKIRYSKEKPNLAKPANNLYLIIGAALLAFGLFILTWYLNKVDFGIIAFLSVTSMIAYLIFKLMQRMKKAPKWKDGLNPHTLFIENMAANTEPLKESEKILINDNVKKAQTKQKEIYRKFAPLSLAIAVVCLGAGGYWAHSTYTFIDNAHLTEGKIIAMKESRSSSTSGSSGYTYAPIVRYTVNGKTYKHTSKMSSSHPSEKIGDRLPIYYSPQNHGDAMINQGLWSYLFQTILIILGSIILFIGLRNMRK
ncbi:MAG: hypothetical protein ACI9TY_000225 [Alphaproteobacteria bacterium]|jgi:hypothetical protein